MVMDLNSNRNMNRYQVKQISIKARKPERGHGTGEKQNLREEVGKENHVKGAAKCYSGKSNEADGGVKGESTKMECVEKPCRNLVFWKLIF